MLIPYTMQRSGLLWQTKKSALKQSIHRNFLSIVVDTETGGQTTLSMIRGLPPFAG